MKQTSVWILRLVIVALLFAVVRQTDAYYIKRNSGGLTTDIPGAYIYGGGPNQYCGNGCQVVPQYWEIYFAPYTMYTSGNCVNFDEPDAACNLNGVGAADSYTLQWFAGISSSIVDTGCKTAQAGNFDFIWTDGVVSSSTGSFIPIELIDATIPTTLQPIASNQTVVLQDNIATPITLTGSDPNSPPLLPLTYAVIAGMGPMNGTLSGTAPHLTYTPRKGYSGPDSFQFTVNNSGYLASCPATVSITTGCQIGYFIGYYQWGYSNQPGVPQYFGNVPTKTQKAGCVLCSLASMLTSYPPLALPAMTPAVLDGYLKANFAYDSSDDINFTFVPNALSSLIKLTEYSQDLPAPSSYSGDYDPFLDTHFCANGERVILKLAEWVNGMQKLSQGQPAYHYILVTAKDGDDWDVFDPGWNPANTSPSANLGTLNGHLVGFIDSSNNQRWFEVAGFRTFSSETSPTLTFTAQCPIELLVTDPTGLSVGFDLDLETNIFEVPGATYTVDGPIVDATTNGPSLGDPYSIKTIDIPAPVPGVYQVLAIGTGTGSYTINARVNLTNATVQSAVYSGTASSGMVSSNSFTVRLPATIVGVNRQGNGTVQLNFSGTPGDSYLIQAANSLSPPIIWTTLSTNIAGTNGTFSFTDVTANNYTSRYYRTGAE
jgi:hypothetical protein